MKADLASRSIKINPQKAAREELVAWERNFWSKSFGKKWTKNWINLKDMKDPNNVKEAL